MDFDDIKDTITDFFEDRMDDLSDFFDSFDMDSVSDFFDEHKNIVISALVLIVIATISVFGMKFTHKQPKIQSNIFAVVVSSNNRTEKLCADILKKSFGEANVSIVKTKAINPENKDKADTKDNNSGNIIDKTANEHKIEKEKNSVKERKNGPNNYDDEKDIKWILVTSADNLLFNDKLNFFIKQADNIVKKDKNATYFQGSVYNKFYKKNHSSSLFLIYYPNLNKTDIEKLDTILYNIISLNQIKKDLLNQKKGYRFYTVIGVDGFFLSPQEIVSYFIRETLNNPARIVSNQKNWEAMQTQDEDYKWALKGVEMSENKDLKIDNNLINTLKNKGIPEAKGNISDKDWQDVVKKYNTQKQSVASRRAPVIIDN